MALNTLTGAPEGTDAVAQLQTPVPANAVPGPAGPAPQDLDFFNRSPLGTLTGGLPPEGTTYTQPIPPPPSTPLSSYEEFLKRLREFHRCRQYVLLNKENIFK